MFAPDFWVGSAEALELTIEGNRLIAREILDLLQPFRQHCAKLISGRFARQISGVRVR